jgi:DNA invertase Pin-like site-specific DNA recombinase
MSEVIGYARVSTSDQTIETQKHAIESLYKIDKWFTDTATSGTTKGREREGLGSLLRYARNGDKVVVYSIDRLGRDTIDVLITVEELKDKGVTVMSHREGFDLSTDVGKLMLTMLASLAELERKNIKARQMAGIARAKSQGKILGRQKQIDDMRVAQWRKENSASIKQTADFFEISTASVKRACSLVVLKESDMT